jgi:hypothetical protein
MKYEIKAMITIKSVSVTALWQRNLQCLKSKLLNIPALSPISIDTIPSIKKLPAMEKGVKGVKSKSDLKLCTVLNRIILTMSLKTPSP